MQRIRAVGETRLIERIRAQRLGPRQGVKVDIGDDAAVVGYAKEKRLLFTSDMLVSGVHFTSQTSAHDIGWKALACNISDIAAMGGRPLWAVVSLGMPPSTKIRFVDELYRGLRLCARRFDVAIVGGDTVRSPRVIVDVAMVGSTQAKQPILRSGAKVGDVLFVTGRLGGSLESGRHARFLPRLREAHALLRRVRIHAMIDLSDGLAADLWNLSRASRVVLRVEAERIPVSRGYTLKNALKDGEDFELLFAVSKRIARRLPHRIGACPVTRIGSAVRRGVSVELKRADGAISRLIPGGFRHF